MIDELGAREAPAAQETPAADAPPPDEPEAEPEATAVPPPEPRWTPGRIRRICGMALFGMGVVLALFLVYEFVFTGMREERSQRALLPQFTQRMATGTFGDPAAPVPSGPVAMIEIPSIGTHQIVVQGSSPSDLKQGPGHMPGTPLPGEFGNSVILGHNKLYGGPFGGIHSLHEGDDIVVITGQGRFAYDVDKVVTVAPGDKDVIGPALESLLTLVTSKSPTSNDRVAVVAKLHGKPVAVPQRPQAFAGPDEHGTSGDSSGLLLAIIWSALLAATVAVAIRLHAVWPRAAAHLVTTPVMLLLLWLIFQSLDLLLPGTM